MAGRKQTKMPDKREIAFGQFIAGRMQKEIAKDVGVAEKTFCAWKKKYNWQERKSQIEQLKERDGNLSAQERQEKVLSALYAIAAQFIKENKLEPKYRDVLDLIKHDDVKHGGISERIETTGAFTHETLAEAMKEYRKLKVKE